MTGKRNIASSVALPAAMLVGIAGFPLFRHLMPALPWMIFLMLFFTFCKIDPMDLRLHRWHWIVLTAQILLTLITYYGLLYTTHDVLLAQGLMACFIMPTATAAPVIAGKLGGSIQNLTTFTLLSNFATAVIVPAFFPLVNPASGITFVHAGLLILSKVGPLLLLPFFLAWALRLTYNALHRRTGDPTPFHLPASLSQIPFWLWVGTLVILMGNITHTMVHAQYSGWTVLWLLVGALLACLLQFFLGKYIGRRFPSTSHGTDYRDVLLNPATAPTDPAGITQITAGQAFGQKNTSLGVWMAQTYLCPLAALGPAAYIVWQNLFNAAQIARASRTPA
ncbi:MAG: transporter [Paludibacteraceae bacterium]|nr:transporter [Paludibacteraceae bacterium]MBR1481193.1 transporter [Paludibacteraceae bacterium]